jgi:uncharacterized protein (TIGR02391 family)
VPKFFTQSQLQAIADALGETNDGLTGSEIGHLLNSCRITDPSPDMAKRHRLYNAFVESQNTRQDRIAVLAFIRKAMKPEVYARTPERFEPMRAILNRALAFAGLAVDVTGQLSSVAAATTLGEAQRRASELRADLEIRGAHPDVLRFCQEELLVENYFHAVLEAVKSVADKLRSCTGLTDDGATLVDRTLGGDSPMLAINAFLSDSEKSEQRGFGHLIKGAFGMFRNPTAHEARVNWPMGKADAEDLLTLVSMIHRRLDVARMPPRVPD